MALRADTFGKGRWKPSNKSKLSRLNASPQKRAAVKSLPHLPSDGIGVARHRTLGKPLNQPAMRQSIGSKTTNSTSGIRLAKAL
jgi:hypothetical protein